MLQITFKVAPKISILPIQLNLTQKCNGKLNKAMDIFRSSFRPPPPKKKREKKIERERRYSMCNHICTHFLLCLFQNFSGICILWKSRSKLHNIYLYRIGSNENIKYVPCNVCFEGVSCSKLLSANLEHELPYQHQPRLISSCCNKYT